MYYTEDTSQDPIYNNVQMNYNHGGKRHVLKAKQFNQISLYLVPGVI